MKYIVVASKFTLINLFMMLSSLLSVWTYANINAILCLSRHEREKKGNNTFGGVLLITYTWI